MTVMWESRTSFVPHFAGGIDFRDAGFEHLDFGFADLAGERGQLAIDVADADFVKINQGQRPHATAGERLDCPRTDAAHADDADVRRA